MATTEHLDVGHYFQIMRRLRGLTKEQVLDACPQIGKASLDRLEKGEMFSADTICHLGTYLGEKPERINDILRYAHLDTELSYITQSATEQTMTLLRDLRNHLWRERSGGDDKEENLTALVGKYFSEEDNIYKYLCSHCQNRQTLKAAISVAENYLKESKNKLGLNGFRHLRSMKRDPNEPLEFVLATYSDSVYTIIKTYSESDLAEIKLTIADACGQGAFEEDTRRWFSQTDNLKYRLSRNFISLHHFVTHLETSLRTGGKSLKFFLIGAEYVQTNGRFGTTTGLEPIYPTISRYLPVVLAAQSYKVVPPFPEEGKIRVKRPPAAPYGLTFFPLRPTDTVITERGVHKAEESLPLTFPPGQWTQVTKAIGGPSETEEE